MRWCWCVPLLVFSQFGCGSPPGPTKVPAPAAQSDATVGTWPFSEAVLPAPPAQRKRRDNTNQTGLPTGLVKAIERLLAQGFADPRGLPYHEVEITLTTQPEGPGERVPLKAFVLPSQPQGHRFGIAWNGLVYRLDSVGKAANVATDIATLRQNDDKMCGAFRDIVPDGACLRTRGPRAEIHSLRLEEILPSHIALLWARGDVDLAKTLWEAWILGGRPDDTPEVTLEEKAIYGRLASHFLHVVDDRAFWAHIRGDDDVAIALLRGLVTLKREMDASRKLLAVPDEMWSEVTNIDLLLADQESRARRKNRPITQFPEKLPADPAERIRLFVDGLDELREPVFAQYGHEEDMLDDKLVHALVAEGVPAIVPLTEAMETDKRMTRSVWYQPHGIKLFSVADVAEIALIEIAKGLPLPATFRDANRKEKAALLRDAAAKYASLSHAERWFQELANDSANPTQWLVAATRIVGPTDAPKDTVSPADLLHLFLRTDGIPPPRMSELSAKKNPSVLDLFHKRMQSLSSLPSSDDVETSCSLGVLAALWDAKLAAQPLADEVTRIRKVLAKPPRSKTLVECLAVLYVARAAGGDEKSLDEYAHWIRDLSPDDAPRPLDTLITPMAWASKRAAIVEAGKAMFGKKNSPWATLLRRRGMDSLLDPRFVVVPGMRDMLLAALDDQTVIGQISIDPRGWYTITPKDKDAFEEEEGAADTADLGRVALGTTLPLRVCDPIAFELGRRAIPAIKFRVYWPEKEKNAAIQAMRAYLKRLAK